ACHQILTVVLSEPSRVPPTAHQRMYGLIQGPEAIPYRKAARSTTESTGAAAQSEHDEADDTLLFGLPLHGTQGTLFRRLLPVAGVLLFAVVLVAAIWMALPPHQPTDKSPGDNQVAQGNGQAKEKPIPLPSGTPEKSEAKRADKTPEK